MMATRRVTAVAVLLIIAGLLSALAPRTGADDEAVAARPRAFATPEALVDALLEAASAPGDAPLRALVGGRHADLIQPGSDPEVAAVRKEFLENAREFWTLIQNEDGSRTLLVGDARWPFPFPIVRIDEQWMLDVEAGIQELRLRRIGHNELEAIALARAYADAQEAYYAEDRDGDGVHEYAQRIRSTPGQRDGLYWESAEGDEPSPFGPLVASVEEYLASPGAADPVGGYYWRVLTGQGDRVPGGTYSYVINGNMIAGYSLLGVPARYGETGVMSFLVRRDGPVLQKDLGACTKQAAAITIFYDPDDSWRPVED